MRSIVAPTFICTEARARQRVQDKDPVISTEPEVLVLLSGGIDSAVCLSFFLDIGRPTSGLFVAYGQAAQRKEARSAHQIAQHYGVDLLCTKWSGYIPKGAGFIPGRNAFILTAALMERPASATSIALGVHAGTQYTDCSAEFLARMQSIFDLYSNPATRIVAPFLEWSKTEILAYAKVRNVPLQMTYSCERSGRRPCRQCQSCLDRIYIDGSE